jgi:hypothetical protein
MTARKADGVVMEMIKVLVAVAAMLALFVLLTHGNGQ